MKHVKVNRIRQCVATVLTPAATKALKKYDYQTTNDNITCS
jgi:hypothetical protein